MEQRICCRTIIIRNPDFSCRGGLMLKKLINQNYLLLQLFFALSGCDMAGGNCYKSNGFGTDACYCSHNFSAMTICLMVCCIAGKICHGISFYRVFAFTDIIMTAIAVGYAVYDIKTSTGWFAGIIGALILMLVVPVLVVLLLVILLYGLSDGKIILSIQFHKGKYT